MGTSGKSPGMRGSMPEQGRVLSIYRPVLNITDAMMHAIFAQMEQNGMVLPTRQPRDLKATIVGAGEIKGYFRAADRELSADNLAALETYVTEQLPSTTPAKILVPTFPCGLFYARGKKTKPVVTIGTRNRPLLAERRVVRGILDACMGVQVEEPDLQSIAEPGVGQFSNDRGGRAAYAYQDFLHRHPDLLPVDIEYGNVHVGDRAY
jgi:hypothetical protein